MPNIAFIFPAYNEEQTIADTLRAFHCEVPEAELWVIDNNSSDNTAKISKETLSEIRAGGAYCLKNAREKGMQYERPFGKSMLTTI